MPTIELTDREAEAVRKSRLTADQRHVETLTAIEAARQARLAAMTPEKRAEAEAAYAADLAERTRVLNLPAVEREAEMLLNRQQRLAAEQAQIEIDLAAPEIAAVVEKVTPNIKPLPVKEV